MARYRMRMAWAVALLVAGCSGGGGAPAVVSPGPAGGGQPQGAPPIAERERWTPAVIPETHSAPVLYEVVTSGSASSASLAIGSTVLALRDDGGGGDRQAGDGVWTVQVPAALVLSRNQPEWVNRPYIGALTLGGSASVYNVTAEVWTAAIGTRPVLQLDAGGQETDYVANYVATAEQLGRLDVAYWARRFYATHPDQFDFLNVVLVAGARGNRYHSIVKNTVSGTGARPVDATSSFGSAGRLQGVNVYPLSGGFDHGGVAFLHETGHQWINYLPIAPFAGAVPHWPKGSVATGVMGFSIPPSSQGGDYPYAFSPDGKGGYTVGLRAAADASTFSMLELYLMGLARADEVPDYFTLKNQQQEIAPGQLLAAAEVNPVRVADIIAAVGVRSPDAAASQKAFRSATIVLSEQPLDAYAMALYDYFARRGEAREEQPCASGLAQGRCKPWFLATGGRSTMSTKIR